LTNDNKKPTAANKPPYKNLDFLGFKSLGKLMAIRKAKFLDLQKLLLADKEKPKPF
jgi:hypothetical protein